MEKLEMLKKQHDIILDSCLEKNSAIYANKCNLENYNQVILVKDYLSRIKRIMFKGIGKSLFLIIVTILIHKLEFIPIYLPSIEALEKVSIVIFGSVFSIETLSELKKYLNDNKKYKNVVKRYDYLSLQQLNDKVQDLEEKRQKLQMELQEERTILNYLKDEIEKEKIKKEIENKKKEEKLKKLPTLEESIEQNYPPIYVDKKDIPKVKLKRRDEKCYKNQKGLMM